MRQRGKIWQAGMPLRKTQMQHTCKYGMGSRGKLKLVNLCEKHAVAVWITTLRALNLWKLFQSVISETAQFPDCMSAAFMQHQLSPALPILPRLMIYINGFAFSISYLNL